VAVLFTEHSMDVVFAHADRVLVMARGALIAEGSPAQIQDDPQVQAVYFGSGKALGAASSQPPSSARSAASQTGEKA
jgi:ABC-type lipopolysaccharide export system ATPase subunit